MKKEPKKAMKAWISCPIEHYHTQATQLVTHGTKSVNTNAAGGGVRVVPVFDIDLPYACVRFGREEVALDYTKNATKPFSSSVLSSQIDAVRSGIFDQYTDVIESECTEISEKIIPLLKEPHVCTDGQVSTRLRQILVNDGSGGDICLTPLHSGGFSERLRRIIDNALTKNMTAAENGSSHPAFFDDVTMKIGGDKAQNAGRIHLVGAMQHAYRFGVPGEVNPELRAAFALYHRGISMAIPTSLLNDYGEFLEGLKERDSKNGGEMRRTAERMTSESKHIEGMVKVILKRAEKAQQTMCSYVGTILNSPASPKLSLIQQGLLDISKRDDEWKTSFASNFAQNIASAKKKDGTLIVGISGRSAESLVQYILGVL